MAKLPKFRQMIPIFESQTEQLLNHFEDDEIMGYGKVPDSACSFSFSLFEYIQIHYIYYQIQSLSISELDFFVSFESPFLKAKQSNYEEEDGRDRWWIFPFEDLTIS